MKRLIPQVLLIFLFGLFSLTLNSCKKDFIIKKERVKGHVQKGPFINGTQVIMSELNNSLEQTGITFSTQIISNNGSFELNDLVLASRYTEFAASGFYFNEVEGELSNAQLTLFALADIGDVTTVNVNILTHLEKKRVEYLVKTNNMSFQDAKNSAQQDVMAIFGFSSEAMRDSETLDISADREDNAILLAISVILQGGLSVGELTELLANISNDIREDGLLSNEFILQELRESTLDLNLESIRSNIVRRYQSIGVNATIPAFENWVQQFLSHTSTEPSATTTTVTNITTTSAVLGGVVNPGSANTTVVFEYSLTAGYGNSVVATQSPIDGHMTKEVSASISGLLPGSTYYFRVKAENENGVVYGGNKSFRTLGQIPSVTTSPQASVTTNSVKFNGIVNPNHLSTTVVFEYGTSISYGQSVTANQSPISGSTNISVSAVLNTLQPGRTYHFRVKAQNALGVNYGNNRTFGTQGTFTDSRDGQSYKWVRIGNQIWMAENLNYQVNDSWCYNDITIHCDNYGRFYTWLSAMAGESSSNSNPSGVRGVCPPGWHLPSNAEWDQLIDYVVRQGHPNEFHNTNGVGNALKSCRQINSPLGGICSTSEHPRWDSHQFHHGFNAFGFSGLPQGWLYDIESYPDGWFDPLGLAGSWWSATDDYPTTAYLYGLALTGRIHHGSNTKLSATGVRCVRDN